MHRLDSCLVAEHELAFGLPNDLIEKIRVIAEEWFELFRGCLSWVTLPINQVVICSRHL